MTDAYLTHPDKLQFRVLKAHTSLSVNPYSEAASLIACFQLLQIFGLCWVWFPANCTNLEKDCQTNEFLGSIRNCV